MAESVLTSSPRSPLSPSAPRGPGSPCFKKKKIIYTHKSHLLLCNGVLLYSLIYPWSQRSIVSRSSWVAISSWISLIWTYISKNGLWQITWRLDHSIIECYITGVLLCLLSVHMDQDLPLVQALPADPGNIPPRNSFRSVWSKPAEAKNRGIGGCMHVPYLHIRGRLFTTWL